LKNAHIFTVELGSKWVVDINDDELPVSLTLIEQSHNTKNLDLLDLTRVSNLFTDFADINWIVVTLGLGLSMNLVRVFPGLGKSTVVPDVTLVGEAVTDITKLALLNVLLNWVESIFLGDLLPKMKRLFRTLSAILQSSFFFFFGPA
jgi:membrane protease YdiL (CAAX protease family)